MNYCAVVCEYNPLHNGHKYQLEKIRKSTGCDGIVCVMSGDFVQRAEPAIISKIERTRLALEAGADMVVELPLPFAIGSGETFAFGAIELTEKLSFVTALAMGCETDRSNILPTLADIQLSESARMKKTLAEKLKSGVSYPSAYSAATALESENYGIDFSTAAEILSKPNNVLAIEYIKALKRKNSNVMPIIIERQNGENLATASQIRELVRSGKTLSAEKFLPKSSFETLRANESFFPDLKTYSDVVMYAMKSLSKGDLKAYPYTSDELCNILGEKSATNLDSLLFLAKSKKYAMSRLKRICLHVLLGLRSLDIAEITSVSARVLGVRKSAKRLLSLLPRDFYISLDEKRDYSNSERILTESEKRATSVYSLLSHCDGYTYPPRLVTV